MFSISNFGWKKGRFKKKITEKISIPDLIKIIQILLVNLETGCTLENSLFNSLDEKYKISNMSMIASLNQKSKQINDKDLFRLVRLINQYHKNGSQSTLGALEKFHGELYMNHLSSVKKKAEEASVKLTLLLMLSLFSIIIVVMTPVVILLKSSF